MIINLTPHAVTIVTGGEPVVIPASGQVARVATIARPAINIDHIPTVSTTVGEITGLPAPKDGVYYLVSSMVLDASGREDLCAPGELIRDPAGQPIGCRGLRRAPLSVLADDFDN